jgi:squalene cyclase
MIEVLTLTRQDLSNNEYVSLRKLQKHDQDLTQAQICGVFELLSYRCRQATKEKLFRRLSLNLSMWDGAWYLDRILVNGVGETKYVAGQDYTAEIAAIRKAILK